MNLITEVIYTKRNIDTIVSDVIEHGIYISIGFGQSSSIAAGYSSDIEIREVDNTIERRKYKFFLSQLMKMFKNDFQYDVTLDKYSNRQDSMSKYYWMKKTFDYGKYILFPVCIKVSTHYLTGDQETEQDDYVINKLNKQSGYTPVPHQKQNPNSAWKPISILDEDLSTYPEAEEFVRQILLEIDIRANNAYISQYKSMVTPNSCLNGKRYSLYLDSYEVETFDTINTYILRLLELKLIDSSSLEYTLVTFNNKVDNKNLTVYRTDEHYRYMGQIII